MRLLHKEDAIRRVVFQCGELRLQGQLWDTPTADLLWTSLPLSGEAARWGAEIYFHVEVRAPIEAKATQIVDPGALCFWCEGGAIALPYGPTPISLAEECRLVAPVNVWGQLEGDPRRLAKVPSGATIALKRSTA